MISEVQAIIDGIHKRWSVEQRLYGRNVCKEKCGQASEEFWFREVIFSLGSPHTVSFRLRSIREMRTTTNRLLTGRFQNSGLGCLRGDSPSEALGLADMAERTRLIPLDLPKYLGGLMQSVLKLGRTSLFAHMPESLSTESRLRLTGESEVPRDGGKGEASLEELATLWEAN
jgi:hypothetical protein